MARPTDGPVAGGDGIERLFEESLLLLETLREQMAELIREIDEGRRRDGAGLVAEAAALRMALEGALEMEKAINARKTDAGESGEDDLELDAARDAILCRLARLRPCCDSD